MRYTSLNHKVECSQDIYSRDFLGDIDYYVYSFPKKVDDREEDKTAQKFVRRNEINKNDNDRPLIKL
ncbi:hypothetical protein LOAG_11738 [Loa loa]|uniref:Uncharacterized protein n=1 Tax=Loa loa TaxID=7209 RepID=A0A1S0TMG8_LOALO|nr:hypothetical protein LOAG_11738 [Loa loa]EFO16765.2 hypothetical protein LOAG_11738 [Loa loa]